MPDVDSISSLRSFSAALSGLVARAAPAVVAIHSRRFRTSGMAWRPGLVVTAEESLADDDAFEVVLPGGRKTSATLAGRDPTTDLALLRAENSDVAAPSPAPEPPTAGSLAVVVGAEEGAPRVSLGVVAYAAGAWRSLRGGAIDARIELDVTLPRRSEGGLVLDAEGRAIGMAVFGPRRRVLVIPGRTIESVATQLDARGRIPRGYLGLGLRPVRLDDADIGAMVMNVDQTGPGATAGVRQGDVIVAWDGRSLGGVHALLRALGPDSVGTAVRLSLRRAGEPMELTVTIGERPEH